MRILVCISGASLCELGLKLLKEISKEYETYAIISKSAINVLEKESSIKFNDKNFSNVKFFDNENLGASVSSGSFGIDKTIVAPCSMNTLAKISSGICDTLITRSCMVALKEDKKLILGVREMPFSAISLSQMSELAKLGVIIAPPVMAGYFKPSNLEDMSNFVIGKWLDLLEIKNNLYKRWENG